MSSRRAVSSAAMRTRASFRTGGAKNNSAYRGPEPWSIAAHNACRHSPFVLSARSLGGAKRTKRSTMRLGQRSASSTSGRFSSRLTRLLQVVGILAPPTTFTTGSSASFLSTMIEAVGNTRASDLAAALHEGQL